MKKVVLMLAVSAVFSSCQSSKGNNKLENEELANSIMEMIDTTGLDNFKIISESWTNDSTDVVCTITYQFTTDEGKDSVVTFTVPKNAWINK